MKVLASFGSLALCSSVEVAKAWSTRYTYQRLRYPRCIINNSYRGSAIGVSHRESESSSSLWMSSANDCPPHDNEELQRASRGIHQPISRLNGEVDCRSEIDDNSIPSIKSSRESCTISNSLLITACIICMAPDRAAAATAGTGPIASAFAAYGHYLGLFGMVACLVAERLLLEKAPSNITPEEENQLTITDALYGAFGLLVFGTGYIRAVGSLGKGFDYYSHEPVFWLKIALAGVLAATSFFNTTKIVQRAVAKRNAAADGGAPSVVEPMSDALAARMRQICNAQLSGLAFIPLAATFMARGVGYNDSIPWQAEAGLALVATVGMSFKYFKEALAFEEKDT